MHGGLGQLAQLARLETFKLSMFRPLHHISFFSCNLAFSAQLSAKTRCVCPGAS